MRIIPEVREEMNKDPVLRWLGDARNNPQKYKETRNMSKEEIDNIIDMRKVEILRHYRTLCCTITNPQNH